MNFIDRALAAFSPVRAEGRLRARARLTRYREAQNLYEAAAAGRRTQHWRATGADANAEVTASMLRVRNVARDMVRNNPFAAKAKMTITNNVVGAGIVPRIESRNRRQAALIREHLETTSCDADGRHNIYGLQALAMGAIVESGEVLIRRRARFATDGLPLAFQLQVVEPDYIDTTKDGLLPNGNLVTAGVEFDQIGRRVAYHLFPEHPGALRTRATISSQRVSADQILHVYRVDRPGQARGISWFAPVVMRMRDFSDFVDAQLVRQKIAACYAAFVTSDDAFESSLGNSSTGLPLESFEPGMIERLRPGESVEFGTPPTTSDFAQYTSVTMREIAAGLGVTYEALTGDLSGVNFSSGRMGWIEFQRNIDAWRWNMLIPQMLDPIARWVSEAANLAANTSVPATITWTPPRREMIDPTKEILAARDSIRAGLTSRSEEIRRMGYDPAEVDAEIAADNIRADDLELIFDSDARHRTRTGAANAIDAPEGDETGAQPADATN